MAVVDAEAQQAHGDGFDPEDFEMPEMPNVPSGGHGNVPSNISPPDMGSGSGGVNRGGTTEATQHPHLAGRDTLVNVRNDDEDG